MNVIPKVSHKARFFTSLTLAVFALALGGMAAQAREQAKPVIDTNVDAVVKAFGFNGSVLVARQGEDIHWQGYGLADVEKDQPVRPNSVFRIASLSKAFTAILALMLAADGKVDLDRPIAHYLPRFKASYALKVTTDQLLSHRSGIAHYVEMSDWLGDIANRALSRDQMLAFIADQPLVSPVGERKHYSTANYYLVAAVLEAATGQRFADLMDAYILKPNGLTDSGVFDTRKIPARLAKGYIKAGAEQECNAVGADLCAAARVNMSLFIGGGAMHSTARDLKLFMAALMDNRLIPTADRNRLVEDYGWVKGHLPISTAKTVPVLAIEGQLEGYRSLLAHFPDHDITLVLLNNTGLPPEALSALAVGIAGQVIK